MLIDLSVAEINSLRKLLRERLADGGDVLQDLPPEEPQRLQLVRARGSWVASRTSEDSGETGIALSEVLQPGSDAIDDPSHEGRTENRSPITAVVPEDKVEIAYSTTLALRLAIGAVIRLHGMNSVYDDGEHEIRDITMLPSGASPPTTIRIRLRRNLVVPSTPIEGYVVLSGAWGLALSGVKSHVVTHGRYDVGVVARIGAEYVLISRPIAMGVLLSRLEPATISGGAIVPSSSRATLGETDAGGHLVAATCDGKRVVVTVVNYDTNVSASAWTFCDLVLRGSVWTATPSCSPMQIDHASWEPN